MTAQSIANQIATPRQNGVSVFRDILNKHSGQFTKVLPSSITAEQLARVAITECYRNPKLASMDPNLLVKAVLDCAQLGLLPDSNMGLIYLVPFGGKRPTVQPIIGYRGLLTLAYRHGVIKSAPLPQIVYENDYYELELGTQPRLVHKPMMAPPSQRGKPLFYYATAVLTSGETVFHTMWQEEIDEHRRKARSQDFWQQYPEEMSKKTALKALFKNLPVFASGNQQSQLATAMEIDNREHRQPEASIEAEFIDGEFLDNSSDGSGENGKGVS